MPIVNGSKFDDSVFGTAGDDELYGFGGDDTLKGFGGADRIDGGAGIDTVFYSDSTQGVRVELGGARSSGGTAEGDVLHDVENAYGSAYADTLRGNSAANELHGLQSIDTLYGNGGNDILHGEDSFDYLDGGADDDRLYGDDGDDDLAGGAGADLIDGGQGLDVARYDYSSAGVFVSLITGTAAYGDAEGDVLIGIENLIGSTHADNLWGDNNANHIFGADGVDSLLGFGGNDTLNGGVGDDSLSGMDGDDFLNGGTGADKLSGGKDRDTLQGDSGDDTLDGGDGNDSLMGGSGADTMRGGMGDDFYVVDTNADVVVEARGEGRLDSVVATATYVLTAGAEIEYLGAGVEFRDYEPPLDLVGNEFSQTIVGNNASNTIVGSPDTDSGGYDGLDVMTGLGGGDVFVWTSTAESGVAGQEADVITDFDAAQGDLIAVNPIDADVTVAGNQAFTFVGTGPFTAAGQISYFTTATDTFILLNTDGDAAQEMTIRLVGVHNVDASWFAL